MKHVFCLSVLFLAGSLFSTVLIVNNMPNTDPDFTTLSAAYTAAAPGDTLYIGGSTASYGDLTLTKPLTIIGTGYFLTQNPHTQATGYGAVLGALTYNSGSSGSLVSGCQISRVAFNTSNIIFKRNYLYDSSSVGVLIASGVSSIAIIQNYLQKNNTYYLIQAQGSNSSLYIANNIMSYSPNNSGCYTFDMATSSSATIEQNVMYTSNNSVAFRVYNTVFQNNIMFGGTFTAGTGTTYFNNIGSGTQFGTLNGNQSNVNMSTVFTLTGSPDANYTLLAGSPAIAAGVNGYDCGVFGGQAPYVLSGMPEGIPSIYQFSSPGAGFVIPAQIKAQAY